MKHAERELWAMLVESEARMRYAEGDALLYHHEANVEIRCRLRDEFNLNLDTLCQDAADKVHKLVAKHEKRITKVNAKIDQALTILEELKAQGHFDGVSKE